MYKTDNQDEVTYLKIIETIRSSLDINETKQKIVDVVGKTLSADRCFIVDYNKKNDDFSVVENEYVSSDEIVSYKGQNPSKDTPNFSNLLKKGETVIVSNKKIYFNKQQNKIDFQSEMEAIKKYKVNSILAIPLYYAEELLGVLNVHYVKENKEIGAEQIGLFSIIAGEVSTAMSHSMAFNFVKKQAEKESILRTIIEVVRSSANMGQTKRFILDVIGKALNAYRCLIITMDAETNDFSVIDEDSVYFSGPGVKTLVNYKPSIPFFSKTYMGRNELFALDTEKFLIERNLVNTDVESYLDFYNVKAFISIPIVHFDKLYGVFIVQYDKVISDFEYDKLEFIRMIAKQIGLAFHQNYLIEKEKRATEREFLLRSITKTIRTSLDIEVTKQQIVNIIGKTFKADRCLILDYDKKNDNFLIIDNEYLSSVDVLSLKWRNPNISAPNLSNLIKDGKPVFIKDKIIYKDNEPKIFEEETYVINKYSINSGLIYPIYYLDELLGMVSIQYGKEEHQISNDDVLLLEDIADQIALALYQAKLYNELKNTTANQNAILNNIQSIAWLKDENNNFLAVNESFAKICNSTIDKVVGKSDFDFFPIEHAESYRAEDSRVMETRATLESVDLILGPKGERWHEIFKSPVFNENGEVIGTVGLANDITERREIETELMKQHDRIKNAVQREKLLREIISEISSSLDSNKIRKAIVEKLGSAIESDLIVIYLKDPRSGKFLPVDEYSVYRASEGIENPIGKNIIEDYGFAKHLQRNGHYRIVYPDIEGLKKDFGLFGTRAELFFEQVGVKSILCFPIVHSGEFLGVMVINFTKERKIFSEETLELVNSVTDHAAVALYQAKLYIQAQEASIAKSEFIANMSHEIKTPLNIIIGFSEVLSNSELDVKARMKYLENINMSGKHLLSLTNDIINISKIESGNFEFQYETFNTHKLISEIVDSLKLEINKKHITLNMDIVDASLNADKKMITQVLYNLLNNSIKFTPTHGYIQITSRVEKNKLLIAVADNGIGIKEEHQNIIFEKFKQVDSSIQRSQQGAGLGLAITKKIIEMHNGVIHVESKREEGTCFWFDLPNAFIN